MYNEKVKLSNGIEIPQLGLGTWMIDDAVVDTAVVEAIKLGYTHIDTAQAYGNEVGVGKGIKASGAKREDLFIVTKLAAEAKDYETAVKLIEGSLEKLDCGYIDLMIIHSPKPWAEYGNEDRYFEGNVAAWKALEEAYKAGKIKAIGVSNFLQEDLENLINNCEVKPMVNQVLAHISNTPAELIDFCNKEGIAVEAYSPIGHGELFKNEAIKVMSEKYGVSIPQLCIRYDLQLGLITLPKTANPAHMKSNADVDFVISDEDMTTLKEIKEIEDYGEFSFFPVYTK